MKFIATTIIAVLCFLTSGFAYRQSQRVVPLDLSERDVSTAIDSLIAAFAAKQKPKLIINSSTLPQLNHADELIDPRALLPSTAAYPYKPLQALYQYARNCNGTLLVSVAAMSSSELLKAQIWHEFLCRRRRTLPAAFFSQAPYMHPGGRSYVALALDSKDPAFDGTQWQAQHRSELHIQELPSFSDIKPLTAAETFLTGLDSSGLKALARAQHLIIDSSFLILRHQEGEGQVDYRVFEQDAWQGFIQSQTFVPVQQHLDPSGDTKLAICVVTDGDICWQPNPQRQFRYSILASSLFVSGLVVLLGNLIAYAWQRVRRQRQETSARIFALRMMTHELRTPVAGIELSLETFRKEFDTLSPHHQLSFMRMCNDVQRLRRLIATSTHYLSTPQDGSLLTLKPVLVTSFNEYVERILEPYTGRVTWTLLATDQSLRVDPYWLEVCIKNLLENALIHGEKPTTFKMFANPSRVDLIIQDGGMRPDLNVKEMTKPFAKQSTSPGLGLGLNIVMQILQVMGGQLSFSAQPTTFTITLENPRD